MARKLASVQKIEKIAPIPERDRIELATVLGWELIIQKDRFKVGDKCVFIEPDSLLPATNPAFAFMEKYKYKVKTITMRGQMSQGLALKLDELGLDSKIRVGADVTECLGITKYEPDEEEGPKVSKIEKYLMRYKWFRELVKERKEGFPKWLPKTDEDRIQTCPRKLEEIKNQDIIITEKLDGKSCSIFKKTVKVVLLKFYIVGVCGRRLKYKKYKGKNDYWYITKKFNILNKMKKLSIDVAIQGEIVGPGIQGNKYGLKEKDFYVYNMYNITEDIWLDYDRMKTLCDYMDLKVVPKVYSGSSSFESVKEVLDYSKGKSTLNDTPREGVVIRLNDCSRSKRQLSFKAINPDFIP